MIPGYSDAEIIDALEQHGSGAHREITALYQRVARPVERLVMQKGGSEEDARDVLQEGLLVLYKNVRDGKFQGHSKLATYVISICKFLWYRDLRKQLRTESAMEAMEMDITEPITVNETDLDQVTQVLGQLEDGCREVLHRAFYQKQQMSEIARALGYKNEQIARNKKYKCMNRLKEIIGSHPELKRRLLQVWQEM